jgi:sugar lactone lactonase YvrE
MPAFRVIEAAGRCRLGEGPLWSPRENALYWVDILGHAVHRLKLDNESVSTWPMPEKIGWIIERTHEPGFVAGFHSGIALLTLDPHSIRHIARPEPHLPNNRLNDAKADAAGRIWAGTMNMDTDQPSGAHYRLDPDHTVTRVDDGYFIANGPAFSPDQRFMYHTDSKRGLVYRFELTPDGRLLGRTVFLTFDAEAGSPDGMTVDEHGCLWIAHWGGARVSRFTPEAKLERSIALPASQITSCTFAGHDLDRMFVTSAAEGLNERFGGALFEVDPEVRGLPPGRFAG